MTNEERQQAIEWLKRRPVMMAGAKRMYDLAIEALEAYVPDMNDGNMISRQAAIDALFELYEYQRDIDPTEAPDLVRQGIYLAEKKIEQLPPAQPTIIRCRDCKYSIDEYNDGDCYCKRPSRELVWIGKSWDFFCKAGDKREGE